MNGIYYYKLVSGYDEDVTKNCKLTVNEIDSNLFNLKSADIDKAEFDEESKLVILTRRDGDKLVIDLKPALSGAVYDLEVVYETPSSGSPEACNGADVYIKYDILEKDGSKITKNVPITGLVTTENINDVLGGGLLSRVITDGSLSGQGTLSSPLGIKSTEKDRPADRIIDLTKGESLPKTDTIGTRYITKEYISDYGYLYNFPNAEKINEALKGEGKGWRVPSKADWDCLLNSIEPCDYQNHESAVCHQWLGRHAGAMLKSACGWVGQDDCECKMTKPLTGQYCSHGESGETSEEVSGNDFIGDEDIVEDVVKPSEVNAEAIGVDVYGMTVLPTGYGDGKGFTRYFKESTGFWTTTHIYNDVGQDLYVKQFESKYGGVLQEAQCPDALFSIRLVKDYTGDNHFDTEVILNDSYRTVLFEKCGMIWTASNFANKSFGGVDVNMGQNPYYHVAYYINVWNGAEWEKRALEEGESVVVREGNPNCQYNITYRVYSEDNCNQVLVNDDDVIVERVIDVLKPIIDKETQDRIDADNALQEAINQEIADRQAGDKLLEEAIEAEARDREEGDKILQEQIEAEIQRAESVEQDLWGAINQEAEARDAVDQQLWAALHKESTDRAETDQQIWEAINNEVSARTDVDNQIWEALGNEASARTDVDNQIWEALNKEITDRTQSDETLWEGIEKEAEARGEVDQQIWTALNNEISGRTQADADLWEGIKKEAEARDEVDQQIWTALNKEIADRIADVDEEEARAKAEESRIEGLTLDDTKEYVFSVNNGSAENGEANPSIVLFSRDGKHNIEIMFNSNYGTF